MVTDVLDLGLIRTSTLTRQVDCLKTSLRLTDSRLAQQNVLVEDLKREVSQLVDLMSFQFFRYSMSILYITFQNGKMHEIMRNSLLRARVSDKESQLMRSQYGELQREATEFRSRMKKVINILECPLKRMFCNTDNVAGLR